MLETKKLIQNYIESGKHFPVEFDEYFPILGYSKKCIAKRSFLKFSFTQGEDFQIVDKFDKVGRPREEMTLTLDCAKLFAFLTKASQGKEVYRLFQVVEKHLKYCRYEFENNYIRTQERKAREMREFTQTKLELNQEEIKRLQRENMEIKKRLKTQTHDFSSSGEFAPIFEEILTKFGN
jgi:phage anti-repressor protein